MKHTTSPNVFALSALIAIGSSCQLSAQAAAAAPEIDLEARKQSVINLERHIQDREERIVEITEDIERLDARVEKQIDKIVDRLKSIEDSKDSQVRVAQTKEQAIDGLRRTIEYYVRKRDELREQIRTSKSAIPKETLQKDLEIFDTRIDKRIEQIIGLAKSFTEWKDVDKYKTWTKERWRRYETSYRISDDWRFNRKATRHTEAQAKEIAEALNKSIETLNRRSADLEEKLRPTNLPDSARQVYEQALEHNEAMISARQQQIDELSTSAGREPTSPVSRSTAHSIELSIRDSTDDLRTDFFAIFEKYAQLNAEREQVAQMTANLQARKDWLEKNAPK